MNSIDPIGLHARAYLQRLFPVLALLPAPQPTLMLPAKASKAMLPTYVGRVVVDEGVDSLLLTADQYAQLLSEYREQYGPCYGDPDWAFVDYPERFEVIHQILESGMSWDDQLEMMTLENLVFFVKREHVERFAEENRQQYWENVFSKYMN